jgi:hypothetical protein
MQLVATFSALSNNDGIVMLEATFTRDQDAIKKYVEVAMLSSVHDLRKCIVNVQKGDGWNAMEEAMATLSAMLPHPAFDKLRLLMQRTPRASPAGLTLETAVWHVADTVQRQVLTATKMLTVRGNSIDVGLTEQFPFHC